MIRPRGSVPWMRLARWVELACLSLLAAWLGCSRGERSSQPAAKAVESDSAQPASVATTAPVTVDAEPRRAAPEAAKGPARYRVFGVLGNDVLNVRAEPDYRAVKVQKLAAQASDIATTGHFEVVGSDLWVQVELNGELGWVNRAFLTEIPAGDACADPQLLALVAQVSRAITRRDGPLLASLLSPVRPLIVRSARENPSVRFSAAELAQLFSSTLPHDWGREAGHETTNGSFAQLFLPGLTRVTAPSAQQKCGEVLVGPSAGVLKWPDELLGLSLYSFYAPALATDAPTWVSWVVGIEYVNKRPYLAALIQYQQEP